MKRTSLAQAVMVGMLASAGAHALDLVQDSELSEVLGQAGLTVSINSDVVGSSTGTVTWNPDAGNAYSAAAVASGFQMNGIGNKGAGIGAGGVSTSGDFTTTLVTDFGSSTTNPAVSLQADWTRTRFFTDNLKLRSVSNVLSTHGFGQMAIDSSGSLSLINTAGLFSMSPTDAASRQLRLTLGSPQVGVASPGSYGQIYYRQGTAAGSPEIVLDKLYLDVGFTPGVGGTVGVCGGSSSCGTFGATASGLYIGTSHLDFNANWAINYRGSPTGVFTTANNDAPGLAYWGWTGGFNNAELLISGGGLWPNAATYNGDNPAGRTQGLNLNFHGDFDNNFNWLVGQAGGRALLQFGNWIKLPGATYALNAPNITFDVINTSQGPGGLCWGANVYGTTATCTSATFTKPNGQTVNGQFVNIAPTGTALGLGVRNLSLQAYSTGVKVLDDMNNNGLFTDTVSGVAETQTFNWALIYALGKVDGNIYLYPGNQAGTGNGLAADVLFMTQSFNNAANPLTGNTSLMIGDTTSQVALGFTQSNVLFAASKLYMSLAASGILLKSSDARFEFSGRFGGGNIPNMTQRVKGFDMDLNLETNNLEFSLFPATSNGYPYLGYGARVTLVNSATSIATADADGSYLSLGEPSRPGVDFRVANMTGDVQVQNGRLFLISAADTVNAPDGVRRLQIAQDILVGTTVSGGTALRGDVKFSGSALGSIAIPSGQLYSSLILKPQTP